MDVADQLQQIGLFLAEDGFVSVLKQMPASFMTAVEAHRISGQQTAHDCTHRNIAGPHQKVEMIWHQGKGIAGSSGLQQNGTQSFQKIIPVLVILEDTAPFDPPADDVMQSARCIYS